MMVESFLPAMRILVTMRLRKEGYSQGKIASLLGLTQASVSFYLSSKPSKPFSMVSALGLSQEEAERYAGLLTEDVKKDPVYAVGTLYSIWTDLLGRGMMCDAHRKNYSFLSHCDVCMRTFGQKEAKGDEAIKHVSDAVSILESSGVFVHVMPQISVNIAYTQGEAETIDDVVAVPGRIVRVKDRPRALMKPEFGASKHLALILLLVRRRMKHFKSAINLRYDRKMEKVLKMMKIKTLTIGGGYPHGFDDPVPEALSSKMAEAHHPFDAVVALGGQGIEPILYLFANDAVEVARLALKIARVFSGANNP